MENKIYRNERKFYISPGDAWAIRSRMRLLARPDEHAGPNGSYRIRSLYFDNYADKAVTEKLSGQSRREKFRLRYYGEDLSFIRLEKKSKLKRLVNKESAPLSLKECRNLLRGNWEGWQEREEDAVRELYSRMQTQQLRPRCIVDYNREAFVYPPGNVRVTLDSCLRTSSCVENFLNPNCLTLPASRAIILEIKFDGFLPDSMRDALQLGHRQETEFSKYVVSRLVY